MAALKLTFLCLSFCLWRVTHGFVAFGGAGGDAFEGGLTGMAGPDGMSDPNLAAVGSALDQFDGGIPQILQRTQATQSGGAPADRGSNPVGTGPGRGFDLSMISRFMPRGGRWGSQRGGIGQMLQEILGSIGGGRGGPQGAVDVPANGANRGGELGGFIGRFFGNGGRPNNAGGEGGFQLGLR